MESSQKSIKSEAKKRQKKKAKVSARTQYFWEPLVDVFLLSSNVL